MKQISYLNSCVSRGHLIRWPDSCMPLTIYIAPFRWYKKTHGEEYKYKQMVIQALNLWQRASGGKISFQVVNTLHESQINLDWKRVERKSLGHCHFNYDRQGRLFSAEVQIGLSDGLIHAQYMDENEVFHTVIHELGHAVGLQHSPFKSDIMYVPHQYGKINISKRDELTLRWLYKFPYGQDIKQIIKGYNYKNVKSLDELVYCIEGEGIKSKFTSELNKAEELMQDTGTEKLLGDQDLLADISKFNMSLQNINFKKDPD